MAEFYEFVKVFGFPSAVLAAILIAAWKGGRWFGENVAKPIVDAHMGFIKTVETNSTKQTENVNKQTESIQVIEKALTEQTDVLVRTNLGIKSINDGVALVKEAVDKGTSAATMAAATAATRLEMLDCIKSREKQK